MRITIAISIALASICACTTHGAPPPQPDATIVCTSAANCDDHTTCTIDNCDVTGVCTHTAIDSMCPMGQHCVSGTGCTNVMSCNATADCDDMITCTVDSCDASHTCSHTTVNSLCSPPTPVCSPMMGCVAGSSSSCTSTAQCDDMVACTVDSCGANMMCSHTPVDSMCPMGQRCTATGCAMIHMCTSVADCMNPSFYNFCDGVPTCSMEFGCMYPTPRTCNDSDTCTIDACDRTSGMNGACTFTCDHSMASCAGTPACPVAAPTCAGNFMLSPAPVGMCLLGMVRWDLSRISITNLGGALSIMPVALSTGHTLDTTPGVNSCPSFTATRDITGGCTEHYTLTGTFSDDNTFTGMFTANFEATGAGGCGNCTSYNYSFTGTRF